MRSLIIGAGEIGKSLHEVFKTAHESHIRDVEDYKIEGVEVLNIAYPYSEKFIEITKGYINQYNPKLVIIHSTVPVGTTRKLGDIAVNSPVNGRHPYLANSIKVFKKIVGGTSPAKVWEAAGFLGQAGICVIFYSSPEASELGKILCTRRYGVSLMEMKETMKLCKKNNVPFHEVYSQWNEMYNIGYTALNEVRFHRPNLIPMEGEIGGHCVVPNLKFIDDELSVFLTERNESYKWKLVKTNKKKNGK